MTVFSGFLCIEFVRRKILNYNS